MDSNGLMQFAGAVASGAVRVVDLTFTLSPDFPVIVLPPEFGQAAPVRIQRISHYDAAGPAWYWNNLTFGEHTGTHFDAPIHWFTGKDLPNNAVDTLPVRDMIAPACVVDCSAQAVKDADFLLTIPVIEAWEKSHGRIPERHWVLLRTDWSKKGWREYAGAGCRRDALAGRGARHHRPRHRDDRNGCRPGRSSRAALSGAPFPARWRTLRPAVPVQSRSASADRRGDRGRAAQDPERLRQSAARSCAGARAGLSPFVHIE